MRKIAFMLITIGLWVGCQSGPKSSDEEIHADVVELIRIESQIVDAAIEFQETADSSLLVLQDSLGHVLQNMSEKLQKKYAEQSQLEKFQEFFKSEKQKNKSEKGS